MWSVCEEVWTKRQMCFFFSLRTRSSCIVYIVCIHFLDKDISNKNVSQQVSRLHASFTVARASISPCVLLTVDTMREISHGNCPTDFSCSWHTARSRLTKRRHVSRRYHWEVPTSRGTRGGFIRSVVGVSESRGISRTIAPIRREDYLSRVVDLKRDEEERTSPSLSLSLVWEKLPEVTIKKRENLFPVAPR